MSNQTLCTTQGLKFRWINGQCFEFVFPNGKVLLSDPYFDDNEHFPVGKGMNLQNFHVEDIERVDYLFVNHTHFDHIYNLCRHYDRNTLTLPRRLYGNTNRRSVLLPCCSFSAA